MSTLDDLQKTEREIAELLNRHARRHADFMHRAEAASTAYKQAEERLKNVRDRIANLATCLYENDREGRCTQTATWTIQFPAPDADPTNAVYSVNSETPSTRSCDEHLHHMADDLTDVPALINTIRSVP